MFGRVIVNKPELKLREFDTYHSFYCGLCRKLKGHGFLSAMSLNYDFVFLNILLNSLYETKCSKCSKRCICHITKKHTEVSDEYTLYVSDMSLILTYYKCLDDFYDDKNFIKLLYGLYLKPKVKKLEKKYPSKCSDIKAFLDELSEKEKHDCIEECANLFGKITATVFVPHEDLWAETLYNIGFYLGKFIYIADAYEDIESDIKNKRPNPLISIYHSDDFHRECNIILNMMAAECADALEKLPLIENVEILRNIIYSGIWSNLQGENE